MFNAVDLNSNQEDDWNHPLLQPYEQSERELDDDTYAETEEIEQMAVAIWTKAIDDHPDLAGPYLRLASALREAGRHSEAADVLRTGTQRGFHHLLTDLINDYPALVTAEEIEAALARPENVEASFVAFVTQRHATQALQALSLLISQRHKGQPSTHFPFYEVCRMLGFLIEDGQFHDARTVQLLLTQLPDSKQHLPPLYTMLSEIIDAETWLPAKLRPGLCQLLFFNDESALEQEYLRCNKRQRRQLFEQLSTSCPTLFSSQHATIKRMDRAQAEQLKPLMILIVSAILGTSATFWLL